MKASATPSDIARETLLELASRRIAPTPEHYRALYLEIAGQPAMLEDSAQEILDLLGVKLPRDTPERQKLMRQFDEACASLKSSLVCAALGRYLETLKPQPLQPWHELISLLLRQIEVRHIDWSPARKREALEKVLTLSDPNILFARLQGLLKAWIQAGIDPIEPLASGDGSQKGGGHPVNRGGESAAHPPMTPTQAALMQAPRPVQVRLISSGEGAELIEAMRELLLLVLEVVLPSSLGDNRFLLETNARIVDQVKGASDYRAMKVIASLLRKYAWHLEMASSERAEVHNGLLSLLRLLLANIDEIAIDDHWLHGQMQMLMDVVNKPANLPVIDDAERRLKEVIFKQSQLKHNLQETQKSLKDLLSSFLEQLSGLSENTTNYHDRIEASAKEIAEAKSLSDVGPLLDRVLKDTRTLQSEVWRSREELAKARDKANAAEAEMARLQQELDQTSHQMRHDQLTGAMNRRGLEETFAKESDRARRRKTPLSLAVLDLDNFKGLNDTYGHKTGDDALDHLVQVVRSTLRPGEIVARYGGEEFVILYPNTGIQRAEEALVRLQRELTKRFFLADNQKLMITFSAGVSRWQPPETMDDLIKRADEAMYEAKRTGKNKVVAVLPPSTGGTNVPQAPATSSPQPGVSAPPSGHA
jgi:diguanylate cyclase